MIICTRRYVVGTLGLRRPGPPSHIPVPSSCMQNRQTQLVRVTRDDDTVKQQGEQQLQRGKL